jgi:hypothetical protein
MSERTNLEIAADLEEVASWFHTRRSFKDAALFREAAAALRSPATPAVPDDESERFKAMFDPPGKSMHERFDALLKGLPNEALLPVGDIRAALYVNNRPLTEKEMDHALELAKEHGWLHTSQEVKANPAEVPLLEGKIALNAATPAASEAHATPLTSRLRGLCVCAPDVVAEGNDDCCDFREAAALIERLVAAEPDEAMVEAACKAHYKAKNRLDEWEPLAEQVPEWADERRAWMRAALKAALTARKETTWAPPS